MMMRYFKALSLWTVLLSAICTVIVPANIFAAEGKKPSPVNCDIQNGECTLALGDRKVTLEILPRPVKAMEELTFQVAVDGERITSQPYIDLNMPAMNMGKNRVQLKPNKQGRFEGKGVIVRCRSGRRTWCAKVVIPDVGAADFIFDVIY